MLTIFFDFMRRGGGVIMWLIFCCGVVIWTIGFERLRFLRTVERAHGRFTERVDGALAGQRQKDATGFGPFDDLLRDLQACGPCDRYRFSIVYRQFLICSVPEANRRFSSMTAWISIAPLLGLLGTVMGMIATFDVITTFGIGNPNLTAEGISVALLTTQAGLTVAFPGVLFQNYLLNRKNRLVVRFIADGERLAPA